MTDEFLSTKAVYLAGPIDNCTYEETHEWREMAKILLAPMKCFDPSDRVFDHDSGKANMKILVEGDKAEIANANAVLVYYVEPEKGSPMTGTTMEIPYAWALGKLVVVVTNKEFISPWVRYHAHYIVGTIEEAVDIIKNFFDK